MLTSWPDPRLPRDKLEVSKGIVAVGEGGTDDKFMDDVKGGNKAGSVMGVGLSSEYLMFVYSLVLAYGKKTG